MRQHRDRRWRNLRLWAGLTAIVSAVAIGVYYGFLAALPHCGDGGGSALDAMYLLVPFLILVFEVVAIINVGGEIDKRASRIVTSVFAALVITLVGGFLVWVHWFAVGQCGE